MQTAEARGGTWASGTIAGVDPNVAIGQVAGPETRGAFASKREADFAFLRLELLLQRRFGERGSQSSAADRSALKIDIGLGRIERHAGVPRRTEDASPARYGKGRVVLFGFRPQFRGQSYGAFKFLLNAIYLASAQPLRN